MSGYFGRSYRLTIEFWRGEVLEIPAELRLTFLIEKQMLRAWQQATITIYNLSSNTETDILKNGRWVTLEAGYNGGPYGVIFSGAIRQPIRGKENATDYFLKLLCTDGGDILKLGFCSLALSSNQSRRNIIQSIARSSTIPFDVQLGDDGNLDIPQSTRAKVLFGEPSDLIRSQARDGNMAFFFDDGQAKMPSINATPPPVVPDVNAQTGMIGIPQQTDQGVSFRTLILPTLTLGNWVRLNNSDIVEAEIPFPSGLQTLLDRDGLYRIVEISYSGDTRGNEWYMDHIAVNQDGGLPTMLLSQDQFGQ